MPPSQFSSVGQPIVPASPKTTEETRLDWRGLDLASPYDTIEENRSPFAKNFRMYAQEADDRRVTISSRKGSDAYLEFLGEAEETIYTTTTGAADASVGVLTEWKAQPFTADATGPLTRVELNIEKLATSVGPVIVEIREDLDDAPGELLATSSILGSAIADTYGYVGCSFIEAPNLTSTETYWIVAYVQNDGSGVYHWSSTTDTTTALTSNNGGNVWDATAYSLNFKTYQCPAETVKGLTRFAPHGSGNETLIAIGDDIYTADDITGELTSIIDTLDSNASQVHFTYADDKSFIVNGFDDLKTWDGSADATITHANLPILRLATFHKNRLFGVDADDPNRLIYSEDPGNDDGGGNFWYEAYLSTSFIYIPAPKASDPITAIVPFQDSLVVFTKTDKFVLYGSDPGSFVVRQATGRKGALSQYATFADENYIYFASDDGIYRYNGASDELISDKIQPEYANIANQQNIFLTKWRRKVRVYYARSGSSVNNACLIYDTVFEEWLMDTDVFVSHAVPWTDGDDDGFLVEASSTAPTAHFAELLDHNLGKPIDFEYHCQYDSFGNPAKKKRIVRLFPLLEAEGGNYPIEVGVDRDRNNNTIYTDFDMTTSGFLVGSQLVGDGSTVGGEAEYEPRRLRVTRQGYYWQVRIKRNAVNNPVQFLGYVLSYRTKRL